MVCGTCAPSQSSPVMGLRAGCGAPPVLSALASLVEKCSSRPPGRCYVVETALLARGPRYVEGRDEGLRHCPPCRSVLCCLHPVEPCRVSVPRSPPASGCRGAPKPPMSPSRTPGRKARGAADVTVRTIAADPFPSPPSLSPLGFQARFCLGWAALNHSRLSLSLSLSQLLQLCSSRRWRGHRRGGPLRAPAQLSPALPSSLPSLLGRWPRQRSRTMKTSHSSQQPQHCKAPGATSQHVSCLFELSFLSTLWPYRFQNCPAFLPPLTFRTPRL